MYDSIELNTGDAQQSDEPHICLLCKTSPIGSTNKIPVFHDACLEKWIRKQSKPVSDNTICATCGAPPKKDVYFPHEVFVNVPISELARLSSFFTQKENNSSCRSDEPTCHICYQKSNATWVSTPCGHEMHRDCLTKWFHSQNGQVKTCPFCRKTLYSTTVDEPIRTSLESGGVASMGSASQSSISHVAHQFSNINSRLCALCFGGLLGTSEYISLGKTSRVHTSCLEKYIEFLKTNPNNKCNNCFNIFIPRSYYRSNSSISSYSMSSHSSEDEPVLRHSPRRWAYYSPANQDSSSEENEANYDSDSSSNGEHDNTYVRRRPRQCCSCSTECCVHLLCFGCLVFAFSIGIGIIAGTARERDKSSTSTALPMTTPSLSPYMAETPVFNRTRDSNSFKVALPTQGMIKPHLKIAQPVTSRERFVTVSISSYAQRPMVHIDVSRGIHANATHVNKKLEKCLLRALSSIYPTGRTLNEIVRRILYQYHLSLPSDRPF